MTVGPGTITQVFCLGFVEIEKPACDFLFFFQLDIGWLKQINVPISTDSFGQNKSTCCSK